MAPARNVKKRENTGIFPLILFVITLLLLTQPAAAYWDPGVGSILWQMIAAVLLGVGYTMKVYWYRLRAFFAGKKKDQ
ncbi:MAG: hypothetical protein NT074_00850 [Methanomicrobiales archaeon]|nr:hypothetical protein [Methanomicrobiales archaeon]